MEEELEKNVIQGNNDLDIILNNIVKDKGGSVEQYQNLLDQIAYHESAGTMNPSIKQFGGGPGRGKYQFEGLDGSNRILTSAVRSKRYFKQIGHKVPKFIDNIIKEGTYDATRLSSEEQDILAISDLRMKKGVDLSQYANGNLSVQDIWADHWWAGDKKLRSKKIDSFNNSMKRLGLTNNIMSKFKNNQFELNNMEDNFREIPAVSTQVSSPQIPNYNHLPPSNNNSDIFKSDFTSFLDNHIKNIDNNNVNEFNNGGTHEQNPHGGIPQGIGDNGKMNTVEEGETSFNSKNGKYIFSNRIKL